MNDIKDSRLWSITVNDFSEFIGLYKGVENISGTNMHTLAQHFRDINLYPARDFKKYCQQRLPDIFITYDWHMTMLELLEAVLDGISYIAMLVNEDDPYLNTEPFLYNGITFWIDLMFINQNARDLNAELDILPQLLNTADAHLVFSSKALTRAWCCYEIALFNQRIGQNEDRSLISFVAPSMLDYKLWSGVESTVPSDKIMLEKKITEDYPGGWISFEYIMLQANLAGEFASMNSNITQVGTTVQHLKRAGKKWAMR